MTEAKKAVAQLDVEEEKIQSELNRKAKRQKMLVQILPFVGLAFVFLFCLAGTGGRLVSSTNLANLIEQCFTVTVVSVGISFVYACGSMDISIGGVMALAELIMGRMMLAGNIPVPVILLAGLCVSAGCALIVGAITTYLRVPTFIVSLCVMNICTGIVTTAVSQKELYIPFNEYARFNETSLRIAVLVLVIALGMIVFNKSRLGRDLKAMGGNSVAAAESGVRVHRTMLLGFLCMGLCVGLAGFFSLTRTGSVTAATGSGLGLNILVAIVLGGFPLTGGAKSRIIGAIVGALTVTVLTNGLALMGVNSNLALFVKGVLFIIIVTISYERSRGTEVK